ncbi:hypothetical protein DFH09DRAFT_1400194 [Mycena vulgaris]|nr:hypothetical protein DFH09DRAFT_1400194 [Mycena vulgaris]
MPIHNAASIINGETFASLWDDAFDESKIVVVEIFVEVLKALALATQMMKQNRIKHFVREVFRGDDMKAVLDRLDELTTIKSRMTVAEMLRLVNQGQIEASGLLGQIDQSTLSLQSQNFNILARLSELHDMELRMVSVLERSMQRISEDIPLSVPQPRAPNNAFVAIGSLIALSGDEQSMIRRDMATLIPVLTTTGLTDLEGSTYALSGLAAAINPTITIGLYTQTIVLYIAAYMIWRLIFKLTSSIPSSPGIDTKNTIVVIDILGLEFRIPLERCATFEAKNTQALWIHCDCGRTFQVSAASQMGPRDTPEENFIEEFQAESSQHTSSPTDFDSFAEQAMGVEDDQDFDDRVTFHDSKEKYAEDADEAQHAENSEATRSRTRQRQTRLETYVKVPPPQDDADVKLLTLELASDRKSVIGQITVRNSSLTENDECLREFAFAMHLFREVDEKIKLGVSDLKGSFLDARIGKFLRKEGICSGT